MKLKDISVGDRVGYRDVTMPIGSDMVRRATVSKVTRKYVHIALDSGIYGGDCSRMFGSVTNTQRVIAEMLFSLEDE